MIIIEEIKSTCNRVDALVKERDSDEFMWEDAIAELRIPSEIGVVVLALLFAKEEQLSGAVCRQVQSLFLGADPLKQFLGNKRLSS